MKPFENTFYLISESLCIRLTSVLKRRFKEQDVIRLISEKVIDVDKYIDARVGLDKAQESFERLTSGNDDAIKIVFKP